MIGSEARDDWRELATRLRAYVARRVPSPADVDDVVQDAFVRLHQGLGALRDEERFGPWVYRILQSAVVDHHKKNARRRAREQELAADPAALGQDDDAADRLRAELGECVALFVARLPSPYREAITLTELEGLTQREAAEMLGVSLSGMKSRVQRGRERVRQMFEQCCTLSVDCRGRVLECLPRSEDAR